MSASDSTTSSLMPAEEASTPARWNDAPAPHSADAQENASPPREGLFGTQTPASHARRQPPHTRPGPTSTTAATVTPPAAFAATPMGSHRGAAPASPPPTPHSAQRRSRSRSRYASSLMQTGMRAHGRFASGTAQRHSSAAITATAAGSPAASTQRASVTGNSPDEQRRRRQREKQVSYGFVTDGYRNMIRLIEHDPVLRAGGILPLAPPDLERGSKRAWDIQLRKWRRALHMFDYVFIDGVDDERTRHAIEQQQRVQWVSAAFTIAVDDDADEGGKDGSDDSRKEGGDGEEANPNCRAVATEERRVVTCERVRVSMDALRAARGSAGVPTKIPVEDDLTCILRHPSCFEPVKNVVPQTASSLTRGTDISPLEAGIKIHIAPSAAVLQRQRQQQALQQQALLMQRSPQPLWMGEEEDHKGQEAASAAAGKPLAVSPCQSSPADASPSPARPIFAPTGGHTRGGGVGGRRRCSSSHSPSGETGLSASLGPTRAVDQRLTFGGSVGAPPAADGPHPRAASLFAPPPPLPTFVTPAAAGRDALLESSALSPAAVAAGGASPEAAAATAAAMMSVMCSPLTPFYPSAGVAGTQASGATMGGASPTHPSQLYPSLPHGYANLMDMTGMPMPMSMSVPMPVMPWCSYGQVSHPGFPLFSPLQMHAFTHPHHQPHHYESSAAHSQSPVPTAPSPALAVRAASASHGASVPSRTTATAAGEETYARKPKPALRSGEPSAGRQPSRASPPQQTAPDTRRTPGTVPRFVTRLPQPASEPRLGDVHVISPQQQQHGRSATATATAAAAARERLMAAVGRSASHSTTTTATAAERPCTTSMSTLVGKGDSATRTSDAVHALEMEGSIDSPQRRLFAAADDDAPGTERKPLVPAGVGEKHQEASPLKADVADALAANAPQSQSGVPHLTAE